MNPQTILERLAGVLIGLFVAIALGYWWGHTATDNAWRAKAADTATQQLRAQQAEAARASQATAEHLAKQRSMEAAYAVLETTHQDLLRRHPLVVAQRGACRPALRTGAAPVGGQLVDAAPPVATAGGQPSAPAPGGVEQPADDGNDDGGEPQLTLAAVRLWNGSLRGADAPAGACGAVGSTAGADAACAADSGLTLVDAWANHHTNAKTCAEDRQRYRDLIEFLTR